MDSPHQKLGRANRHLQALKRAMRRFVDSKPYRIATHVITENDRRFHIFYVEAARPIPNSIPLIVGDIANNLRASLDHILWKLHLDVDSTFDENVYFPICDTADRFRGASRKHLSGLPPVQKALFKRMQPCNRRNDFLCTLRGLNNSDKHRLPSVVTAVSNTEMISITGPFRIGPREPLLSPIERFIHIEEGAELLRIPVQYLTTGSAARVNARFRFEFRFGDIPPILDGRGITTTMRQISEETRYVVNQFNQYL